MNKVISDTAEYGCYLFANTCVPLLSDFVDKLDSDVIGNPFMPGKTGVDNLELIKVNAEIRNHPVEIVGKKLRGYMKAMKSIL
jgi:ketol-acid reductoisomerase